jgi:flagellum-specific peptidoglycan hydrolase FlgJ
MQSTYAGKPELMLDAMSHYLGVNHSQAMALATIGSEQIGGLQKALAGNGVDLGKMSFTGISSLAQIATGSRSTLNDQAKQLWPQLNAGEQGQLDQSANSGDTEKLRSTLLKLVSTHGQVDTEGSQTRKTIQDLDKDLIDQASKLLGPLNQMRDIMLYAFGERGKLSAADIHQRVISAQKQEINDQADNRIKTAKDQYLSLTEGLRGAPGPALEKKIRAAADNWHNEEGSANWDRWTKLTALDASEATPIAHSPGGSTAPTPAWMGKGGGGSPGTTTDHSAFVAKYSRLSQEVSQQTGISPNLILAQIAQETGWGAHELSGSFNPFNIQKGSWIGKTLPAKDKHADDSLYSTQFRAYGSYDEAAGDYSSLIARNYSSALNAGDNVDQFTSALQKGGYAEDPSYAKGIAKNFADLTAGSTPLPNTGASMASSAGGSQKQSFTFDHNITLQYPNGQPAATPLSISKTVTAPTSFGSN